MRFPDEVSGFTLGWRPIKTTGIEWVCVAEGYQQGGLVQINRLGPTLRQKHGAYAIANFVLMAELETVQLYAVDA